MIGNLTRVKVVKNKVAPPFKQVEFDILYGRGISRIGEVIDIGSELDILEKAGTWYSYAGQRLGQGKEKVRDFLQEHPDVCAEIEKKIREAKGVHVSSIKSVDEEDLGGDEAAHDDVPPMDLGEEDLDL